MTTPGEEHILDDVTTVSNDDANSADTTVEMEVENLPHDPYSKSSITHKKEKKTTDGSTAVCSPEWLKQYYSRLFPFDLMHSWLSYGKDAKFFGRREFSFTLQSEDDDEIYIRYQSFLNAEEFKKAVIQRVPIKMDIGAVYNMFPKDKHSVEKNKFVTQERELVFDIDLTDYDDIRKCGCQGAAVCPKCWPFMNMAVKVVDTCLRDDFQFQHIAWFYSGRRGVHCWVSDEHARSLSNEARSAVASYMEVALGTSESKAELIPTPIHPALQRAHEQLEPYFCEFILPESGHGLLCNRQSWRDLLATLPSVCSSESEKLDAKWAKDDSDEQQKWNELKQMIQSLVRVHKTPGKRSKKYTNLEIKEIQNWIISTIFKHTYPRLDINVSKMQNHLLKTPFGVHPKTGRVCVYIQDIETFDPFKVPTLADVLKEVDEKGATSWKDTSLQSSFHAFEKDILKPLQKEQMKQARESREQQAAIIGDF